MMGQTNSIELAHYKSALSTMLRTKLLLLILLCYSSVLSAAKVTEGFKIEVYADDVPNARQMALSKSGIVYVGSRKEGKVFAVIDSDNDYKADKVVLIAKDLYLPSGVAYKDGDLYVAEVNQILRFKDIDKNYQNTPKAEIIFNKLPNKSHHGWKYIKFGPDGRLYIPIGVPCNVCLDKDSRFGTIIALNIESGETEVIATGVRNSVGFDWNPNDKDLWFTDNGRDWLGDDSPPCELNHVSENGQFFGFPFVHGKEILDPKFGKEFVDHHPKKLFRQPAWEFQAHVAPLGMLFYTGDMFPKEYKNTVFVAQHGSWNRSKKVGYKIVNLTLKEDTVIQQKDFVTGWLDDQKILGRPNDVIMLKDGSLLISDDGFNIIYRVTYLNKMSSSKKSS